jgi:hypothetical protein
MELGLGATIIDLIKTLNYREPSINIFEVYIGTDKIKNEQEIPIIGENGLSYIATTFSHKENHANNFNSDLSLVKTIRNSSGDVIKIETVATTQASQTEVSVGINDNNSISQEQSITYTFGGVSKNGEEIKKQKTVYFYFPHYIGVSTSTTIDEYEVSSFEQINSRSFEGDRNVTVENEPRYIWFLSPNPISDVTCKGTTIGIQYSNMLTINGTSYYSYRTQNEIVGGDYILNVVVQNKAIIVNSGSGGSSTQMFSHNLHITHEFENDEEGIQSKGVVRGKYHGYATFIFDEGDMFMHRKLVDYLEQIGATEFPTDDELGLPVYPASGIVHLIKVHKDVETGEFTGEEYPIQETVPCGLFVARDGNPYCWFGENRVVQITYDMDTVVQIS